MAKALLHPGVGETWTTPYFRMIRYSDLMIRNGTTGALAINTAWADSEHTMTLTALAGVYPWDIPSGCTSGDWHVMIYERAGAAAASTDSLLATFDVDDSVITNSKFHHPTSGQTESISV
jgi:hypothetical protein